MLSDLSLGARGVCGSASGLRDLVHREVFGSGRGGGGQVELGGVDCGRIAPWGCVRYSMHTARWLINFEIDILQTMLVSIRGGKKNKC